ncbi:MAG: ABC transporter substrate-binding protein [Hyphomicrobiales bacterium]|nr:ABC transporter substrate-binding protein [Hyphomicrobiales bacterium]
MKRRSFLAASAASLAFPFVARAQTAGAELKFIPQADLVVLDPHWTTAYVTRNHGFMVFDTLYGTDGNYRPSGQMVEGHVTENDAKEWKLTLRDGLKWHDGEKVLARDCVASIRRWGAKDAFGQALLATTDELSAPDDRTIRFRLKAPFPLLPAALGKSSTYMPAMLPERLAKTDPGTQITEMIGSGPFRFKADERVPGARAVYTKFNDYVPIRTGTADWTAGPKVVHVERVVWTTTPDPATAAASLQSGEQDWWDYALSDLLSLLRKDKKLKVVVQDPTGQIAIMRMNHLVAPFNNEKIRQAMIGAVNQADFMTAVAGDDKSMWRTGVGVFTPGTPMANDAGMQALNTPRDMAKVKETLKAAGYNGEKVVLLAATDFPVLKAMSDVGADMLQQAGMNVDYVATDWGTVVQRRASRKPVDQGGWNVFFTAWAGSDMLNPAGHLSLRANGDNAWFGWPNDPKIEELRNRWFAAPDQQAQQKIAAELQQEVFTDVPYVPLGQYLQATAFNTRLSGVPNGFAIFWNVQKEG